MNGQFIDHLDFYTRGPYAPFVKETRSAGDRPIQMVHTVQPAGDFSDPAQPDIVLLEMVQIAGHVTRDLGAGRLRRKFQRGDFEIVAPGVATDIYVETNHELRGYILPLKRICGILGDADPAFNGDFGFLHAAPFRSFFLEQICRQLWLESEAGNPYGDLFADGALISIAATLLRLRDGSAAVPANLSNPLVDRLRKQIDEYIDANLDQTLASRDLASLVDQQEAFFAQAFKVAFGQTPHQYVLSRRIARAQELLATGNMPLAEVAYACGFASQSHMTDVFRQKLGVTPGRYRKEVRS